MPLFGIVYKLVVHCEYSGTVIKAVIDVIVCFSSAWGFRPSLYHTIWEMVKHHSTTSSLSWQVQGLWSVLGSGRDLLIAVIYRPPNTDMKLFIDAMRDVLEKVQQENKLLYLVGDYNINLLNVDSHSLTADFNDTIYSYSLVPLITRPTRVTETSATLIDNIFTNKSISYDESMYGILVSDISAHYPIFCIMRLQWKEQKKLFEWYISLGLAGCIFCS